MAPLRAADADPADGARQAFTVAMLRIKLHQPDLDDAPALKSFVIYDYLLAARLRRDLAQTNGDELDDRIDEFLTRHGQQPVSRGLRRDWLSSLAQRARWDWFLPRSADLTDPVLICQRLAARLAAGDTATLAADALVRWSLPQRQLGQCAPVFAWLKQQNLLTAALAESRTRLALGADNARLAREFAADVPAPQATKLLRWSDLLEAPKSALNVLVSQPTLPIDGDALMSGFDKLSRIDARAALDMLPGLLVRPDATAPVKAHLQRSAALGAAYDRDPRAVAAFGEVPPAAADNQVQEWRVRAALWAGDYRQVRAWIEQMPPDLLSLPRWRYWRARAIASLDGLEAATPLYGELATLRDYYGYLAADRLVRPYRLNAHPSPDDADTQRALSTEPGLMRAHELFACEMTDEAGVEWAVFMSGSGNALKVQAARLAGRWGWYSQSIATLAQSGEFDDVELRYPRPYADSVADGARMTRLPDDLIYSVMRQESLYRKDAVSRADARGLMQMLPSTATAVARRWGLKPPTRDTLFDPTVAIPLGAAYLRELLDRNQGSLGFALAAYNAGQSPVDRWTPPAPLDADVWIENIPYNETRNYVQRILEHLVAFSYVCGAEPPRLNSLLSAAAAPPGAVIP